MYSHTTYVTWNIKMRKDVLLKLFLTERKRLAVIISHYHLLILCSNATSFLKPSCIPFRLSSLLYLSILYFGFYVSVSPYFIALQSLITLSLQSRNGYTRANSLSYSNRLTQNAFNNNPPHTVLLSQITHRPRQRLHWEGDLWLDFSAASSQWRMLPGHPI